MDADKIAHLSMRLLKTPLADDGAVFFHSTDYRKLLSSLRQPLQDKTRSLLEDIRERIPTDFSYSVVFSSEGADVSIDFEDGNTAATAFQLRYTSIKSLRRNIAKLDWEEARRELIEQGGIFEELVSQAEDRPVNIPSSEAAAARYGDTLAETISEVQARPDLPPFALIIARDDLGISVEVLKSRDEIVYIIADRMTTRNDILAVLERGVCWPFSEIETAKLEAVEQLGPISRAKAEGRLLV